MYRKTDLSWGICQKAFVVSYISSRLGLRLQIYRSDSDAGDIGRELGKDLPPTVTAKL